MLEKKRLHISDRSYFNQKLHDCIVSVLCSLCKGCLE